MLKSEDDERKEVCDGSVTKKDCIASAARSFEVIEEEFRVYNKGVNKDIYEVSLGEKTNEAKKIGEGRKVSTRTRKKKIEKSLWNFPDLIPSHPFCTAKEPLEKKKQFAKFVVRIKKVYIDMPLVDITDCIPRYMKFVNEILANKDGYSGEEVIPLSNKCSWIIQKAWAIPLKVADSGNCTIPCDVDKRRFEKALCNLEFKVSIMPMSIVLNISILEDMKPSTITLHGSLVKPNGILRMC